VSDAGGEILELLDDVVEGGPTGKDEQNGLRVRVRRVRV